MWVGLNTEVKRGLYDSCKDPFRFYSLEKHRLRQYMDTIDSRITLLSIRNVGGYGGTSPVNPYWPRALVTTSMRNKYKKHTDMLSSKFCFDSSNEKP